MTATVTSISTPYTVPVLPPSVLLLGAPGAGKTTSLATYIKAGLELFVLFTDPRGEEVLLDALARHKLPIDKLHWAYVAPSTTSWDTFTQMGKLISVMGYKELSEIKSGVDKAKYQQFLHVIATCANFKCLRTGKEYGAVDSWGPDRAFVIDSLSGLNIMALDMITGAKPTAHQGEWGVAMNAEEKLLLKFTSDLKCHFALTAHIEREPDITTGAPKIMVSALGQKLAPKIPRSFSEVILAYREGTQFYWSTVAANVDLKNRSLPMSDKLAPDFGQLVEAYKKRVAFAQPKPAA